MQNVAVQPQTIAVPGQAGVNIQIFNPSVMAPGTQPPVYNVNAPNYGPNPAYPSGYYTNQWGNGAQPLNSANQLGQQQVDPANQGGNNGTNSNANSNANQTTTTNTNTNITTTNKNTEKRKIVDLTDEYIKNLENYLNSQDKEIRLMGAKEVVDRLTEDETRADDKALNALINKMIQDPASVIRVLGLSMLDARLAKGDETTVKLLQNMQSSTDAYGMDAVTAANVLLKMSGKQIEKEFEVKPKKETK